MRTAISGASEATRAVDSFWEYVIRAEFDRLSAHRLESGIISFRSAPHRASVRRDARRATVWLLALAVQDQRAMAARLGDVLTWGGLRGALSLVLPSLRKPPVR